MLAKLRTLLRATRLIVHLSIGLAAAAAVSLDFTDSLRPEPIARRWSRRLLRILGIRVSVRGRPFDGSCVIAANHISWLDIPLLAACGATRFVAKSEIRDWPVAGWLANAAGTFYIRRGKGGARPVTERLVPHLCAGGSVVLFPEGTTTNGRQLMPFHARLFAAAVDAAATVQPVALRYSTDDAGREVAPFVGDDDLFRHILRLLGSTGVQAEVVFCAAVAVAQPDRDALAGAAEDAVAAQLGVAVTRGRTPQLVQQEPALAA
jgi:lyso-ornithine lipid O-acyltransferase